MRIGEVAERVGINTKTIRYYEDIGLLPHAERAANGYRVYRDATVERLGFIQDAQASGLRLTEIATILDMRNAGEPTCEHVAGLLEGHLRDIDAKIRQLEETRRVLSTLTDRASDLDPADCTDPNRCQTIQPRR